MRVLHVIMDINRSSGGPSRSSQGLVAALNRAGVETWLVALRPGDRPWVDGVTHFETIGGAGEFPDALARIKPDIVHVHGIWSPALHAVVRTCRLRDVPYVIAPRGMLEPWSLRQKWLKKRIARILYQDADLRHAAALHATAESEAAQFRKLGFGNPVIISPNGVNAPDAGGLRPRATADHMPAPGEVRPRALFVSRMHPKKGVLELVESWSRVRPSGWQCELVYTKNGDAEVAYEQQVKQRILDLGMTYVDADVPDASTPDFIFTGPLDDARKWSAYARADLFVLPTYSENFGIVVAEALWAGLPVITTKGTPWRDLETHRCGWWIDLPKGGTWEALDDALREATSTSSARLALSEMGVNGHKLVVEKYTWSAACKSIVSGYCSILNPVRGNTGRGVTEK